MAAGIFVGNVDMKELAIHFLGAASRLSVSRKARWISLLGLPCVCIWRFAFNPELPF